jgi:hypothetical protein
MSDRYLLDTSILIVLFADETAVKEKLAQASEVFIPQYCGRRALLRGMEIAAALFTRPPAVG